MNRITGNGEAASRLFKRIPFDGFEVSWAGPGPFRPGFCFGSDDSRLFFTDEEMAPRHPPKQVSVSGEAINGVARVGSWLAVTTRQEVNILGLPSKGAPLEGVVFPHGAHG